MPWVITCEEEQVLELGWTKVEAGESIVALDRCQETKSEHTENTTDNVIQIEGPELSTRRRRPQSFASRSSHIRGLLAGLRYLDV